MPLADTPYELASDRDLESMRDRYESMALGEPERLDLRVRLANEYARRMVQARENPSSNEDAYQRLLNLLGLWTTQEIATADPKALAGMLAPYRATVQAMRVGFARSGQDIETTGTLLFLSLADPTSTSSYIAEIDEIFQYADGLARAQYGEGAESSRPIAILESIVEKAPIPVAVDRLLGLYLVRQDIFTRLFKKTERRMELIRAHGADVLDTAWHIVRVLARAGRLAEAEAQLARFQGVGKDMTLVEAVQLAMTANTSPAAWSRVVRVYQKERKKEDDARKASRQRTVLTLCREGMARFPDSVEFATCAAEAARQLNLLHAAIRYYEQAVQVAPASHEVANQLAELYRVRVSTLAFYERPLAAGKRLAELESFHAHAAKTWPQKPLEADLADAYASMGRGMTSIGELAKARKYLRESLSLRPSLGAHEQLGTIAFKQGQHDEAIASFQRALALDPKSGLDQYNRARILRLAGDAMAAAGSAEQAEEYWKESIGAWIELSETLDLPDSFKGELLVESGKAQWQLGDPDTALLAFDHAIDVDHDGADTHSSVIAFLIVRGYYRRALDAYHRALGSQEISAYNKVYMSLWVVTETRRNGEPPDPIAVKYLASRKGQLWHDELAQFASGKTDRATLERKATTRGRRAEMLYYSAVLDDSMPRHEVLAVMQQVASTGMILFYEYDMAKYWLSKGFKGR